MITPSITNEDKGIIADMLDAARDEGLTQARFKEGITRWLDTAGYEIEHRDAVFRYAEKKADRELPLGIISSNRLDMARRLCRETAHALENAPWYGEILHSWPAPIAHELARLVEELRGRQLEGKQQQPSPEAALLQMRDAYEVLIKTVAIILVRALIESDEEQARWARAEIFREGASAGSWRGLLREAATRVKQLESLKDFHLLAESFSQKQVAEALNHFISARNNEIGHGALSLDPVETAEVLAGYLVTGEPEPAKRKRVSTLTQALAELCKKQAFKGITLVTAEEPTGREFSGASMMTAWLGAPDHAGHDTSNVPLFLQLSSGRQLSLAPFLEGRICVQCARRDVQLFDSLYERGRGGRFDLLDYARGHRSRLSPSMAENLAETFALAGAPTLPAPLDGSLNNQQVIERLDRARVERNYLSPRYLREDFAHFLTEHDRGIYWLQAPAHIGKTTFVQGIAEEELNEEDIDPRFGAHVGSRIAIYYCKKEYRSGQAGFFTTLAGSIRRAFDLAEAIKDDPEPSYQALIYQAEDKRSGFLFWIDAWRARARKYLGSQHGTAELILIIDGLDEADDPEVGSSLLDVLPESEYLPEGLYILLTSRLADDTDCPDFVRAHVTPLLSGNTVNITRLTLDSEPYLAMLSEYIAHQHQADIAVPAFHTLSQDIIHQAERRFIYVSFLTQWLVATGATSSAASYLGCGDAIYRTWLAQLDWEYGQKQADAMREVLLVLAAAEQAHKWIFGAGCKTDLATGGVLALRPEDWRGLAIDLVAMLTNQDRSDEKGSTGLAPSLVATLFTLQGALGVWRGNDGTARYRLGLKDLLSAIKDDAKLAPQLPLMHARIATAVLDAAQTATTDGWTDSAWRIFAEQATCLEASIALSGSELLLSRFDRYGLINLIEGWIATQRDLGHTRLIIPWQTLTISLLLPVGLNDLPTLAASLQPQELNNLATAYTNRGSVKLTRGDIAGAIEDSSTAIEFRELIRSRLGAECSVTFQENLAGAYINRGRVKLQDDDFVGSIADYDTAIKLMESIRSQLGAGWTLDFQSNLAGAYMNMGVTKMRNRDWLAYQYYDAAIELMESIRSQLGAEWTVPYQNDLAAAYLNRGVFKGEESNFAGAIVDFDSAIQLREIIRNRLGAEWSIPFQNELAGVYMNRGHAKSQNGDSAGAFEDCGTAIQRQEVIRNRLGAEWPASFQNSLAKSYMNLAWAHNRANDGKQANEMMTHAATIWASMESELGSKMPPEWAGHFRDALTFLTKSSTPKADEHEAGGPRSNQMDVRNASLMPETRYPNPFRATDAKFLNWRPIEEPRHSRLLLEYFDATDNWFAPKDVTIMESELSFYPDLTLAAFSTLGIPQDQFFFCFKNGALTYAQLDSTNEAIFSLNEKANIVLTPETQIDYLRFFFHFVYGRMGVFNIVETSGDIDWTPDADEAIKEKVASLLLPLTYRGLDLNGLSINTATVIFKDSLFKVDILVASRSIADVTLGTENASQDFSIGQVLLTNEELLMENLPIKIR